jgi:hypothetical protein
MLKLIRAIDISLRLEPKLVWTPFVHGQRPKRILQSTRSVSSDVAALSLVRVRWEGPISYRDHTGVRHVKILHGDVRNGRLDRAAYNVIV